jgi:uncharacterized protein
MPAPASPHVRYPVMMQAWRRLAFLHWRYPPEVVQALLPAGLRVETFDGAAWVGLIPFLMDGVRPPYLPALPWLSRFPETNLRTYVTGPDDRSGIWFLSLDAARAPAALAGRLGYGLPYQWARMAVRVASDGAGGGEVVYRSRRRGPDVPGASCDARVALGAAYAEAELGPLDHFLTARFRLYGTLAGRLVAADAEHPPWQLRRARLLHLREDLVAAGGLPAPAGEPLVHAADGVAVRIGMWRPAGHKA